MLKSFHILHCLIILQLFLLPSFTSYAQQLTTQIHLNQVGFYPHAGKIAVVTGDVSTTSFYITSTNTRDTFFKGELSAAKVSAYSQLSNRIADFSSFQRRGSYVILIPGLGHSYVFSIDDNIHNEAGKASLKGFYFQRISMHLDRQFAGKWHRSAGHPDDVVLIHSSAASKQRPAGTVFSSVGGWYDAGDYNKYIVNSGITMGTLFSAYEDFPVYYDSLNILIPESNNAVPDILDESVYNLRWMLTMQDPYDGGVYHKCTNAEFDGMVMPGVTRAERYMVQKSTPATLDFAAVMAQASRIYKKFSNQFPGLADSCLKAAMDAWKWAQKNPLVIYNQRQINEQHKPAINTGEYGDRNFKDEWLWAASELFITTKEKMFFDTVTRCKQDAAVLPSWGSVGTLGYYSMLRFSKEIPVIGTSIVKSIKDTVIKMADKMIEGLARSSFNVIMGQSSKDFVWGSNAVAANQGILMINAYLLTNNKKYIDAALHNADYLLGRNATGYSFLTGIGSKSPMHPHHRPSEADGIVEPVPGLLAGGSNPGMQDKCTYTFKDAERAYTDDVCSYASNEIAINWNAPAVYLFNALEALQQKAGYSKN